MYLLFRTYFTFQICTEGHSIYIYIYINFVGWDETESTWYVGLYQPRIIDEYGEFGGMRIGRGTEVLGDNLPPCHFVPAKPI
jgi:hypothetical protein